MRMLTFARRTAREILRDGLNLFFGLGFPLVVLLLLSAIQANIPVPMFEAHHLTPGIAVFGLSFLTLFSALLLARDRESAFLTRLYTTPMTAWDFIFGYLLPMLPMGLVQCALCYLAALPLGLEPTVGILWGILAILPICLFYISLGLLCGSILNSRQAGGVCGALLTNLSAWLSGIWFDVSLVGGVFQKIADALPFLHAVELARAAYRQDAAALLTHLPWVLGYAAVTTVLAVLLFLRQMKQN